MSAIRLVEVRGPDDDIWLRFHPEITVVSSTVGVDGRVADQIVDLLAGRRNGLHLRAESDGNPVAPGELPETLVDAMVLRDRDLRAAIDAVRSAAAQGGAEAELAGLRARRAELTALAATGDETDGSVAPEAEPLLDAWRALATDVQQLGPIEPVEDLAEIERRIRQAESVLRQPDTGRRVSPEDAAELRARHEELEAAQRAVEKRASRRALKSLETAEAAERELLDRLGISSYLDFVLGVATTSTAGPQLTPDEATAMLVEAQAARQAALEAEQQNTRRQELVQEVNALRMEVANLIGRDPGDDVETALLQWKPGANDAVAAELAAIDERMEFLESMAGTIDAPSDDLDEILRHALADHPWPEGFGPLPILIDDALVELDPDARMHALGILAQLANEVQVVVLTDDPRVSEWGRAQGPHALVWEDDASTAETYAVDAEAAFEDANVDDDRSWQTIVQEHDDEPMRSLSDVLGVFTAPSSSDDNVVDLPARDPWAGYEPASVFDAPRDDAIEAPPAEAPTDASSSSITDAVLESNSATFEAAPFEPTSIDSTSFESTPAEWSSFEAASQPTPAFTSPLDAPVEAKLDSTFDPEVADVPSEPVIPDAVVDAAFAAALTETNETVTDHANAIETSATAFDTEVESDAADDDAEFETLQAELLEAEALEMEGLDTNAVDPFNAVDYDAAVADEPSGEDVRGVTDAWATWLEDTDTDAAEPDPVWNTEPVDVAAVVPEVVEVDLGNESPTPVARDDFWVDREAVFEESWLAPEESDEDIFAGLTPDEAYDAALDFEVRREAAAEEAARREEAARLAAEEAARREEEARVEAEANAQRLAAELEQFKADEAARREAEQRAREEAEAAAARLAEEAARVAAEDARREIEEAARRAAEHAAHERQLREEAEAARQAAEARARLEAEEAAARAEEERRLREEAERARLEAEETARRAAEQAEAARREAERMRQEAEDEALIARLKAEAQAIIAAEDRAKLQEAEDARREAEAAAARALEMRERAEHERNARREAEAAASMALEAAARAEEAAQRAAAESRARPDDAHLAQLEAELEAARKALAESRARARDLARLEAQEVAQRDAEELAQRAAINQWQRDASPLAAHEIEGAAERAAAAARRAEEAAARAELAARQELEDQQLLERLEAEAANLRSRSEAPPSTTASSAPATPNEPVTLFRAPEGPVLFGPQSEAEAASAARRAEEAAARAEEAAARAETMLPAEAKSIARSVREEAIQARDHADRLNARLRTLRSSEHADPHAIQEAEEAARRAETSAARAEEAAARAEAMSREERLQVVAGPWAGYDAGASAARAEEAAARAEEAASRAESMVTGEKADMALSARREATDARHFADELARRAEDLQAASHQYDPVVIRDAAEAARRAETSAQRAEEAASRAEWLALQEANRARAEAAMYEQAAPPPELQSLEAEELEQVADGDDAGLYELPQEDVDPGPMRGLRKRRAEKLAKKQQRQTEQLLDTASKLTKRCVTHNLEDAVAVCGRCEKSYCRHCIVKVGSRGENLCVDCALQAAGVRSARGRRR